MFLTLACDGFDPNMRPGAMYQGIDRADNAKGNRGDMAAKNSHQLERSATHLIHRAGQCATDIFQAEARSSGLTPRQFAVLMTIAEQEGLTQTDLVDRTGIDRSTLADIVARLLARGLIHRKRAKEDGRAYAIKLTSQGWKGLRDAEPGAAATDSRLLSVLPPPKRQEFLDILAMIVDATDGK
jgi:DNA-binding MarR family transcriptional regulator